jgi:hypothetical protein
MAIKTEKQNFSEVITIDSVSLKSYKYTKNELQPFNLDKSSKKSFFISYIQSKDVISASINLSRNISEDDIEDAIEIKVYDELGLDSTINYKITYLEVDVEDTANKLFNVFVIDAAIVGAQLSEIQKKTSYIDYVTTAPFLIKSLYQKALLEPDGIDCFIYFQKNDAFLALYKGGEYLYSKSLAYSLTQLTERFCELVGERVSEEDFHTLLTTEGLKSTNPSHQSHLMQLFGELFLHVNDVLIFAKRSFSIEQIDRVYIGSEVGILIGIDEYAKSYLGLESFEFNFSISINSKEWYVDQIHILMALTSQVYLDEKDDELNFSIFKRPPPLKERPVGKLLGVIAASLILSFAYPAYQFGFSQFLQLKINKNTDDFNKLSLKTSAIRAEIARVNQEKEKIIGLLKKESEKLDFRKKLLTEINKKRTDYNMKILILSELINISNQYKSKISMIEYDKNNLTLSIQNTNEKNITEFITALTKLQKYKISTDEIVLDDKNEVYLSQITIGL